MPSGACACVGGDDHEAAVIAGRERVVEGAGGVLDRVAPAGRAATRSRRAAWSSAGPRPSSRRPGGSGRRPCRSDRSAPNTSRQRPRRRAGRRLARRCGPREGRARPRARRARPESTSVSASVAPSSASRRATTGPRPPPAPAIAIVRPSRLLITGKLAIPGPRSGEGPERTHAARIPAAPPQQPKKMSKAESRQLGIRAVSRRPSPASSASSQPTVRAKTPAIAAGARPPRGGAAAWSRSPSRRARRRRSGRRHWCAAASTAGRPRPPRGSRSAPERPRG